MYKTKNILFFFFIILFFNSSSFAQEKERSKEIKVINGNKYYIHTVTKGQTLYYIAKLYGQGVNDIVIENPEAIDGISPGQTIKILVEKKIVTSTETIDSTKFSFHKVEKKETLYSISKKYNLKIEEIKSLNPQVEAGLKEGELLKLPKPVKTNYTVAAASSNILPALIDSSSNKIYNPVFKPEYNIAVFLPFNANQANAIDVEKIIKGDVQYSLKTKIAIQYYQGALMAIDSLKKNNLNAKIYVYDVENDDSLSLNKILAKKEFKNMDLIIGPIYGSSFIPVAQYAKTNQIPIVSPLTQANKILYNNNYVCKVTPTTNLQMEQTAKYVVDSFASENIILLNNGNTKEISYFNSFKDTGNKYLLEKGKSKNDSIKIAKSLNVVIALLKKDKKNIVILPSNNQSYVTDFISKLYSEAEKYSIILVGMQNWTNFDNLDFEYLNKLSLHIPANNHIEYDSINTKNFMQKYFIQYNTDPDLYVFHGFDVTYYFLSALMKYGKNFTEKITDYKTKGISTNFNFYKFASESGFENKDVFILKYNDYKLVNAR